MTSQTVADSSCVGRWNMDVDLALEERTMAPICCCVMVVDVAPMVCDAMVEPSSPPPPPVLLWRLVVRWRAEDPPEDPMIEAVSTEQN